MQIQDLVSSWFFDHSAHTRRRYTTALSQFCAFLGATFGSPKSKRLILQAEVEDALRFFRWLKDRPGQDGSGTSDRTLRSAYSALRSIYRKLELSQQVERNIFDALRGTFARRHKADKRPTAMIPFEKVYQLLDLPNPATREGIRDRALLSIMFGGGLRRSEARNLRVRDVLVSAYGTPFLDLGKTKSGKVRHQPLPAWASERFSVLVCQRRDEGAQANDPLFVFYYEDGKVRGKISESTQYRTFQFYCAKIGIKAAPHAARATAASMLKAMGKEDRDVQEFLGHNQPGMVAVYDKRRRGVEENCGKMLDFPKCANS